MSRPVPKKIRMRTIVVFLCAGISGTVLFYTSQNVQQAERDLQSMQASIRHEEESIRVLRAEWAYLNNPERIESLASEYLRLRPATPDAMKTPADLPQAPNDGAADKTLLQAVSATEPAAGGPASSAAPDNVSSAPAPVPGRKPAAPAGDFNALLKSISGQGAR